MDTAFNVGIKEVLLAMNKARQMEAKWWWEKLVTIPGVTEIAEERMAVLEASRDILEEIK